MANEKNTESYCDLAEVYDGQIASLMSQVGAICREHGLPFVAIFQHSCLDENAEQDSYGFATSGLKPKGRQVASELVAVIRRAHNGFAEPEPDDREEPFSALLRTLASRTVD